MPVAEAAGNPLETLKGVAVFEAADHFVGGSVADAQAATTPPAPAASPPADDIVAGGEDDDSGDADDSEDDAGLT